jgi:hypothetical protein
MNHQPRKENHMNTVQKAILRTCWQEEQCDTHAPRPWLRWLLIRVVGMTTIPSRKSEKSQLAKEQWLALRKDAGLKIDPETAEVFWVHGQVCDPYGLCDLTDEERCIGAITSPARPEVTCGFALTTCRTQSVIAYGQGSKPATFDAMTMTWRCCSDADAGVANPTKAPATR